MNFDNEKNWLNRNGVLELFDCVSPPEVLPGSGTTGLWVGNGGLILTTCSGKPIHDLYDRVEHMLWSEVNDAYLNDYTS